MISNNNSRVIVMITIYKRIRFGNHLYHLKENQHDISDECTCLGIL